MQDDLVEMSKLIETLHPFHEYLGIKVASLEPGKSQLRIAFRTELLGQKEWGALHGGVISTLADVAGVAALRAICGWQTRISTIDLRVDYLKPALRCGLVAEGLVVHCGKQVGNATIRIFSDSAPDVVIAEGRGVYNLSRPQTDAS